MKAEINFINSETFQLGPEDDIKVWVTKVIQEHNYNYSEINYTFLNDNELLDINRNSLGHDFYTDIITFDNTIYDMISADIFLSVDRIKDNAQKHNVEFVEELRRVMIHGILHCMGYKDNDVESKTIMRSKEDEALNMFHVEQNRMRNNV